MALQNKPNIIIRIINEHFIRGNVLVLQSNKSTLKNVPIIFSWRPWLLGSPGD